jgi:hypothetical protein
VKQAACLVPLVRPGIQFSIAAFPCGANIWSLECAGFRRNTRPSLDALPSGFGRVDFDGHPEIARIGNRSCEFGLALVASRILLDVSWIFYSDSLGMSAVVRWENGNIALTSYAESAGEGASYGQVALTGAVRYIGVVSYVDDELFQKVYSAKPLVWMLMENKNPLTQPRLEEGA